MRTTILTMVAVLAASMLPGAAEAATPAQFGAKCKAAWTGAKSGGAFGAYQAKCVTAATRAANRATDAGNPTNGAANATRAKAACSAQFKPPRNTAAKRKAYAACIKAAVAAQVAFGGRPLTATLSGASEVPPTGTSAGTATITLNQGQQRVCYTLTATDLEGATVVGAHIHQGASGAAGGVVIQLSNATSLTSGGVAKGCEEGVPAATIKAIRQNPGSFYVNVHTSKFPDGAMRGQLTK